MSVEVTAENLGLDVLSPPAGSTRPRKRVGRGQGSGQGKTSGRGQKGQGSRSGKGVKASFEGGQMPLHMRLGKLRGPNHKKSMPIGPFRTEWRVINVGELGGLFGAGTEVTPEALVASRRIPNLRDRVKLLGEGEVDRALTVRVHGASKSAREKIEAAGGTVEIVPFVERGWRERSVAARGAGGGSVASPEASATTVDEAPEAAAAPPKRRASRKAAEPEVAAAEPEAAAAEPEAAEPATVDDAAASDDPVAADEPADVEPPADDEG